MALTYLRDPQVSDALTGDFSRLWYEVSEAGGAVGYVPPVDPGEIRAAAARVMAAVHTGRRRMLAAYGADGRLVGTTFLALNDDFKMLHWATVVLVMIDPALQGGGHGRELMAETLAFARELGLEALRLEVRGGTGIEHFYARTGFKEVGRVPDGLRLAPGDDRDDILMWRPLD
ncbi:GNAT family N-acetyltransferase [Streptomyces sp. NPDC052396]|uniref:GNAT family N-acetyltransferase n=1 Tax=Streptomyces sp. NPDC052396 TaxID=3365689 RepID=UPI0037CD2A4D